MQNFGLQSLQLGVLLNGNTYKYPLSQGCLPQASAALRRAGASRVWRCVAPASNQMAMRRATAPERWHPRERGRGAARAAGARSRTAAMRLEITAAARAAPRDASPHAARRRTAASRLACLRCSSGADAHPAAHLPLRARCRMESYDSPRRLRTASSRARPALAARPHLSHAPAPPNLAGGEWQHSVR